VVIDGGPRAVRDGPFLGADGRLDRPAPAAGLRGRRRAHAPAL